VDLRAVCLVLAMACALLCAEGVGVALLCRVLHVKGALQEANEANEAKESANGMSLLRAMPALGHDRARRL
jgi:hypothetical protein